MKDIYNEIVVLQEFLFFSVSTGIVDTCVYYIIITQLFPALEHFLLNNQ